MTYRNTRTVECDQCLTTATIHGVSKRKALRLFSAAGWELERGLVADLCPPCSRVTEAAWCPGPAASGTPETTR